MAHELYNQPSKYLDASYRRTKNYQQEVDFILRRVGNRPGKKILIDVACGSGGHAELLSKAGFSVYRLYDTHVEARTFQRRDDNHAFDFSDSKRSGTVTVFVGRKER